MEEEERGGEGLKHCAGWMINEWKKFLNGRNFRNRTSAGSETTSGVTKPFQYMGNKGDSEGPRPTNQQTKILPRDRLRTEIGLEAAATVTSSSGERERHEVK